MDKAAIVLAALLATVAGPISVAFAQPTGQDYRAQQFESLSSPLPIDDVTQADDVGLREDRHERMTIPVTVEGAGPYHFLVDTGADRSAVSRQLASSLKLRKGSGARLHGIAGPANVDTAQVSALRLSERVAPEVEAALLDSDTMGADGIVGVDALRSQRVLFDFKAKTMSIVPSSARAEIEDKDVKAIVVTGRLRNGRLLFTRAYSDGGKVTVVVDTGSEVTVANERLRRRLHDRGKLRTAGFIELQSVTGQTLKGEFLILDKLEIGGVILEDLPIVFADAHTFKQLGLNDRPALLLGMNAMRAFDKVSIDFTSRKLRLIMPEHSSAGDLMMVGRRSPALLGASASVVAGQ